MKKSRTAVGVVALLVGMFVGASSSEWGLFTPRSVAAADECQTFAETGKQVCGIFLTYWRTNGGLAQQGLPISDVFEEKSDIDGRTYQVQYFERAVFERHPENAGTKFEVLLSLLGAEKFRTKYLAGLPSGETPLQVGQTVTLAGSKENGTFRVRIDAIQEQTELPAPYGGSGVTRAKGKFVIIAMRADNTGRESDSISGYATRLKDNQGRFFDPADTDAQRGAEQLLGRDVYYETIQPGLGSDIVMVFDVAPEATTFSIAPRTR